MSVSCSVCGVHLPLWQTYGDLCSGCRDDQDIPTNIRRSRVFCGLKEHADYMYCVGQVLITEGPQRGQYKDVTREYGDHDSAQHELDEWCEDAGI